MVSIHTYGSVTSLPSVSLYIDAYKCRYVISFYLNFTKLCFINSRRMYFFAIMSVICGIISFFYLMSCGENLKSIYDFIETYSGLTRFKCVSKYQIAIKGALRIRFHEEVVLYLTLAYINLSEGVSVYFILIGVSFLLVLWGFNRPYIYVVFFHLVNLSFSIEDNNSSYN